MEKQAFIKRCDSNVPFTMIANSIINDKELNSNELALLVYLLSKPSDWKVVVKDISTRFNWGRDKTYSVIKGLCDKGYMFKIEHFLDNGRFNGVAYIVYSYKNNDISTILGVEQENNPITDNPLTDNPTSDNKEHTNKYYTKKDYTKEIITRLSNESQAVDSEKEVVERTTSKEYEEYIQMFNSIRGSAFRGDAKSKRSFKGARKKYTMEQLERAVRGAVNDEYHKSVNYKYITPEFMLREDKIEKFLEVYRSLKLDERVELEKMKREFDKFAKVNDMYHRRLIPMDDGYEPNLLKMEELDRKIKQFRKEHGL